MQAFDRFGFLHVIEAPYNNGMELTVQTGTVLAKSIARLVPVGPAAHPWRYLAFGAARIESGDRNDAIC